VPFDLRDVGGEVHVELAEEFDQHVRDKKNFPSA